MAVILFFYHNTWGRVVINRLDTRGRFVWLIAFGILKDYLARMIRREYSIQLDAEDNTRPLPVTSFFDRSRRARVVFSLSALSNKVASLSPNRLSWRSTEQYENTWFYIERSSQDSWRTKIKDSSMGKQTFPLPPRFDFWLLPRILRCSKLPLTRYCFWRGRYFLMSYF